MTGDVDRAKLKALVQASDRSARDISLKAGLGATAVKDILSGKSKRPEYTTLVAISRELSVDVSAFTTSFDNRERPVTTQHRIEPRFLPVRYRVKAGLWEEIEFAEPPVQVSLPVLPDPRFASFDQWLELVEGDSVDLRIPPGHFAHVVDAISLGYAPRDADWVVVERRRDNGRTRERTIKQIEVGDDRTVRLRTRSRNPIWGRHAVLAFKDGKPILEAGAKAADDATEVEIVGLVIGTYDPSFYR